MVRSSSCLVLLAAAAGLALGGLVDNGTVITLNGVTYYMGGSPVAQLHPGLHLNSTADDRDFLPMTIIDSSTPSFTPSDLEDNIEAYTKADDVFQDAFLDTIYLRTPSPLAGPVSSLLAELPKLVNSKVLTSGDASLSSSTPKGPYFVSRSTGYIFPVYRLYTDDLLAFLEATIEDGSGGFVSMPGVVSNAMSKSIAVPSRLYYEPSPEKPLAGLRLGVKDIYHVRGMATSGGNRAYYHHYGVQNATAPAIQKLIDLGAVVVGKMGTVQFANGDNPTADWVDFHCPFNPRGDGYQQPSGSSTGPGVAIAGYDWLDISVGSDTGGSMRYPAAVDGIYGNRPSTGAISMDHVIPLSPVSDSAGVFARSGALWANVTQAWYPDMAKNFTSFPKHIWYAPLESMSDKVADVVDGWLPKLEKAMGISAVNVDYTKLWDETKPADAPATLEEMLDLTYAVYISHDQWEQLGKGFFADYAAANDGRQPYINPGPLARWKWGWENATDEIYQQALSNITTFKTWWETEAYGTHNAETCSEGLYVFPFSASGSPGEPSYRDIYFDAPTSPPIGFGDGDVSILAGVPEVVLPIGEVPYYSTRTMHTEYLPITVGFRMARGCDWVLASLVRDLENKGVISPVRTGSRI